MGQTSWPIPNEDPELDRLVTDVQYERLFAGVTGTGLIGAANSQALVYADGTALGLKWRPYRGGVVHGHPWWTDGLGLSSSVDPNGGTQDRIDLAVLRLTRSTWQVTAEIRKGVPGMGPPAPVQELDLTGTGTGIWEHPVAEATVRPGVVVLAGADVRPLGGYLLPAPVSCLSTRRPAHLPGLRIFETDTGRVLVSTGAAPWLVEAEDTGDLAFPYAEGWGGPTNTLRRKNGWVFMAVSPQRTGAAITTAATKLGNLPDGFKPSRFFEGLAHAPSSGPGRIELNTSGLVQVYAYGGLATTKYINVQQLSWAVAAV